MAVAKDVRQSGGAGFFQLPTSAARESFWLYGSYHSVAASSKSSLARLTRHTLKQNLWFADPSVRKETRMLEDKSQKKPQDAARVNVNERYELTKHPHAVNIDDPEEVRYWTRRLRCTRWQLISAVAKVGFTTSAVEEELKQRW
jgi:hypothetical protein